MAASKGSLIKPAPIEGDRASAAQNSGSQCGTHTRRGGSWGIYPPTSPSLAEGCSWEVLINHLSLAACFLVRGEGRRAGHPLLRGGVSDYVAPQLETLMCLYVLVGTLGNKGKRHKKDFLILSLEN